MNSDFREDCCQILSSIQLFFDQTEYAGMASATTKRNRLYRVFSSFTSTLRKFGTVGHTVLIISTVLLYKVFRKPEVNTDVFEFGMSANNERSFKQLNTIVADDSLAISMNGLPISFWQRLGLLRDIGRVWAIAQILAAHSNRHVFVYSQQVLGAAGIVIYSQILPRSGLQAVCISNDHSPICMALIRIAKRNRIATCYIQHAPVTKYFPPLCFDLSILFDRASHAAYEEAALRRGVASEGKVVLLSPFVTDMVPMRTPKPPYDIGVCLSLLPSIGGLAQQLSALGQRSFVHRLSLRQHPRCTTDIARLVALPKVEICRNNQSQAVYFEDRDVVLVPNSGIALEALHCGRPTFYIRNTDMLEDDYYGFVATGVLPVFDAGILENPAKVVGFFDLAWRERFSFYDETAMTSTTAAKASIRTAFYALLQDIESTEKRGAIA